jgi:hypothetical protein
MKQMHLERLRSFFAVSQEFPHNVQNQISVTVFKETVIYPCSNLVQVNSSESLRYRIF